MVVLTADDHILVRQLEMFVEPVEVRDEAGKILGMFVPANLEKGQQLYAQLAKEVDWADIEERTRSKQAGKTTAEVLKMLDTLAANNQEGTSPVPSSIPTEDQVLVGWPANCPLSRITR